MEYPFFAESAQDGPVIDAVAVTPADGADLQYAGANKPCRGFMVGLAGNMSIDTAAGSTVLLTAVQAGIIHWIQCKRIRATSTTATGIVAFY